MGLPLPGIRLAAAAACLLAALGLAYYFTVVPAPVINVRWREDVTAERRAVLERRFLLVRPRESEGRTVRYDLLDTSTRNLAALVDEPDVDDTTVINRLARTIPFDYRYGEGWTWVAHRVPVLRVLGVVEGLVVASVVIVLGGVSRRVVAQLHSRSALTVHPTEVDQPPKNATEEDPAERQRP